MLTEYLWCVVVGGIFCFTLGFGIGANDVSNNFGTSVGSKSISLRDAIIIAAIFEFIGSVALGGTVTDSLRKGVYCKLDCCYRFMPALSSDPEAFRHAPDILMFANLCALMSGTFWLLFACSFGLPVSTSHSLIGAMVGCGLSLGVGAVNWSYMGTIALSWLVSPILSCLVGMIYFKTVRKYLLRSKNAVKLGYKILWVLVWSVTSVFSFFFVFSNPMVLANTQCRMLQDGSVHTSKPCHLDAWAWANPAYASGIASAASVALTLILAPICYWRAMKALRGFDLTRALSMEQSGSSKNVALPIAPTGETIAIQLSLEGSIPRPGVVSSNASSSNASSCNTCGSKRTFGGTTVASLFDHQEKVPDEETKSRKWKLPWNQDLHTETYSQDKQAEELSVWAEKFDPATECFFQTLQVVSASVACLVHGSNDVSNAAAPYATVYSIYRQGVFLSAMSVPVWILILGGAAISFGLTFMGHRVIKNVGIRLLHISPSRGFCIEMAMATVMIIGSFFGLPLSTTHVAVGAMMGVALLDSHEDPDTGQIRAGHRTLGLNLKALNWKVVRAIALAWAGTMIVCAALSATIFSFAVYSPTRGATTRLGGTDR